MTHSNATKNAPQRRITLLRHAKAEAEDAADGDHGRPLAPRGREDAGALGTWLAQQGLAPDVIFCSTATRTRQTLAALGVSSPVVLTEKLYLASAGEILSLLQEADDADQHVMVIGHNPGLHGLVALLARQFVREADAEAVLLKFPTCALISMTVDVARWRSLSPQSATVDELRMGKHE